MKNKQLTYKEGVQANRYIQGPLDETLNGNELEDQEMDAEPS